MSNAFPFFPILTLIFVTLKLCGTIGWSWWLVLLPAWGPVALGLFIAMLALCFAGLVKVFESHNS